MSIERNTNDIYCVSVSLPVLSIQLFWLVLGSGLCGDRQEGICQPGTFKWHALSSIRRVYGVHAGVYGFSAGGMVLSVFGLHGCGDSDGAIDRAAIRKSIPFKALELFWEKIPSWRLYLPCCRDGLGWPWHPCDKIHQPPADGSAGKHPLPARLGGFGFAFLDSDSGCRHDHRGAA